MIITEKLEIIVKNNLRKYYANLGYIFPFTWDPKIIMDIKDLPKNSNLKIDCKCNVCGKIKNISYYHYNKNIKIGGFYSCKGKCSRMKYKSTCIKKFGFENPFQNEEIKKKSKETCMRNYGVDNSLKCINIKKKVQNTMIKNYNVNMINRYRIKKYKDTNIYYQGTYELDFLEKFYKIGIEKCKSIKYGDKIYFPDYFFSKLNLIIEIKSEYIYKLHESKNLEKQKSCIDQGYNFIFIINKNYKEFEKLIYKII